MSTANNIAGARPSIDTAYWEEDIQPESAYSVIQDFLLISLNCRIILYRKITAKHPKQIRTSRSITEALAEPFSTESSEGIASELTSHEENNTCSLVDASQHHRIIGSMWVFKILYDQKTREIDLFKAKLVGRGYSQQYGVNYDETYAPVACFTSLRVLIEIAAHLDLDLEHIDITTAYLYGNVDAEIYMRQPPG